MHFLGLAALLHSPILQAPLQKLYVCSSILLWPHGVLSTCVIEFVSLQLFSVYWIYPSCWLSLVSFQSYFTYPVFGCVSYIFISHSGVNTWLWFLLERVSGYSSWLSFCLCTNYLPPTRPFYGLYSRSERHESSYLTILGSDNMRACIYRQGLDKNMETPHDLQMWKW